MLFYFYFYLFYHSTPQIPTVLPTRPIISSDCAEKQIPDHMFQYNRTQLFHDFPPTFVYLKYNGTVALHNYSANKTRSYPSFLRYEADPNTKTIKIIPSIPTLIVFNFDDKYGRSFVNSTENRFVWEVITGREDRSWTGTLVDAESGVVVGYWNACPYGPPGLVKTTVCPV